MQDFRTVIHINNDDDIVAPEDGEESDLIDRNEAKFIQINSKLQIVLKNQKVLESNFRNLKCQFLLFNCNIVLVWICIAVVIWYSMFSV